MPKGKIQLPSSLADESRADLTPSLLFEIGKLTGGIDYSAVNQARKRLQLKIRKEPQWANKFNQIQNKLGQMSRVKI